MPGIDDVEVDEADRSRIEYLSGRGSNLTEAEAERIVCFAKLDRSNRDPSMLQDPDKPTVYPKPPQDATSDSSSDATNGSRNDTDGDTDDDGRDIESFCRKVRTQLREADRPTEVTEQYPDTHPSAIFRHAEGRCDCNVDVDPTTSPRVKAAECSEMRRSFRAGATKRDIMSDFERSANAVNKHLFGECDHPRRRDNPASTSISATECGHLREAYRNNEAASIDDIGFAFGIAASTAYKHLLGKCSHDIDVEPIPSQGVTAEACDGMRRAYKRDPRNTPASISRDFGTSRSTADYHIFGRCECDGDEPAAKRR